MPRPTIAYLNARREAKPPTGGRTYRTIKLTHETLAAARERLSGDPFEEIRERTHHRFAAMRASDRERLNTYRSRLTNDDTF